MIIKFLRLTLEQLLIKFHYMLKTPKASDTIILKIISENSAILVLLYNNKRQDKTMDNQQETKVYFVNK